MKKAIIAALLLCALVLLTKASEPGGPNDARFLAICMYAQQLDNEAKVWNEHCASNINAPDCQINGAILRESYQLFLQLSNNFRAADDSKWEDLKARTVENKAKEFAWNVQCGAQEQTKERHEECAKILEKINKDKAELQKEIDKFKADFLAKKQLQKI